MVKLAWKVVNDGYSGDYDEWSNIYVISSNHCSAKRIGAWQMGTDYEYVTAYRAPELDEYSDLGYIPPEVLIKKYGWEYECNQCGTKVAYDKGFYTVDEDWEEHEINPVFVGRDTVYCSQQCRDERLAEIEEHKKLVAEAKQKALEKFKQSEVLSVYRTTKDKKDVYGVELKLPYLEHKANWIVDDTHISVCKVDEANYLRYKKEINDV